MCLPAGWRNLLTCLWFGWAAESVVGVEPDLPRSSGAVLNGPLADAALTSAGDAARGRKLFHADDRTKCGVCHVADGKGGKIGPDLSKIGGKFDRIHLIESILEPSKQIVEGYQTTVLVTADGVALTGIVRSEDTRQLTIEDAAGKTSTVAIDEIESRKVSDVSIMPDDLERQISADEFADLIAYLETLKIDQGNKWGSDTNGPIRIAEGFRVRTIATGLDAAVALEVLDDGRVLIAQQTGSLRVVANDRLIDQPMLHLDVEHYWERGLIGVTVDPDFANEPWVYVCYVVDEPYTHHVVARFPVQGNIADPSAGEILLEGDDQESFGGFKKSGHQGGAIHFGPDGCLYIGLGEQTAKTPSQSLDALQGKILRIHRDGSIPDDNPLIDQTEGKYQSIWAMGCRNPFTFAIDDDGTMMINDVGGKFEEINRGVSGANYGWGSIPHGPTNDPAFTGPIHFYPESSINGGDFAPTSMTGKTVDGKPLAGRYFFADYVQGFIRSIDASRDPVGGESLEFEPFAAGLRRVVDLRFADDGSLYALVRNAWVMDDKFQNNAGSLLKIEAIR